MASIHSSISASEVTVHKRWFVGLFFLVTLLPVATMLVGLGKVGFVDENRRLAPVPGWEPGKTIEHAARTADAWFSDHFGLRSVLIRLKTQIDYSVFGTSNRVHIGRNGWMFYRTVMDIEKPGIEEYLKTNEAAVLRGVQAFATALDAKGIKLLLTVNLLADRFVPDQLPNARPNMPSPPRIDGLMAKLSTLNKVAYVDATAILKQVETTRSAFHRTDFHWNDPGAFDVARALVERIGVLDGRPPGLWRHQLAVEKKVFSGGVAAYMPVFRNAREDGLFVKPTSKDPPGLRNHFKIGLFEWGTTVEQARPELLPMTVVIGDSFVDGIMRSGFHSYFNGMWRLRWGEPAISEIAGALPVDTRYVVVQFIEVGRGALTKFADASDIAKAVEIIARRAVR
jgi:SGNH hydrolase-like domain, acetyltransferase AlgX